MKTKRTSVTTRIMEGQGSCCAVGVSEEEEEVT